MADEQLSDDVLQRARDDDSLSEEARAVVIATLARRRAAALTTPDAAEVAEAAAAMREAAAAQSDAERTAGALSADRIQFLETSLEFRERHGAQPCPVCAEGSLDDEWVVRARAALAAEQDATGAFRAARSGAHRARQRMAALVRSVEAPPAEDAGLSSIVAARVAYQSFSAYPSDDDVAHGEHMVAALPALTTAYDALRAEASASDDGGGDAPSLEAQEWLRVHASSAQP